MTPSLSNPFNRNPMNTQPTGPRMAAGPEPAIVRFRVKEFPLAGTSKVARCHLWNGTTEGITDYAVAVISGATVNSDLYANRPYGGTGVSLGATKVVWREVGATPSVSWGKLRALWLPGQYTVSLQPVMDAAGNPYPSPVPNPVDAFFVQPLGKVPAYFYGEVNDLFAYEQVGGANLIKNPIITPIPVRKWEVIQNVADAPTAPQWQADYMRAHNLAPED